MGDKDDIAVIRYAEDEEYNQPTKLQPAAQAQVPKRATRAHLMVVSGSESVGRCIPVEDGMIIGRGAGADVVLKERGISRRHVRVSLVQDGSLYFEDCGSSNGLLYGGTRVSSLTLREGDRVQIGDAILVPLLVDASGYAFERNLYLSATADPSTTLTTAGHFMTVAERECALAARYGIEVVVGVFAVDQHHVLLQTHGAAVGPALLRAVAHAARDQLPPTALVARHGIDALVVLFPETSLSRAGELAALVQSTMSSLELNLAGHHPQVTLSGGLSGSTEEPQRGLRTLLAKAEARLVRAKSEGTNRLVTS